MASWMCYLHDMTTLRVMWQWQLISVVWHCNDVIPESTAVQNDELTWWLLYGKSLNNDSSVVKQATTCLMLWCSLCSVVPCHFRRVRLIFLFIINDVQKPWSSSACLGQLWALPGILLVRLLPSKCFFCIKMLQLEKCCFLGVCFQVRHYYLYAHNTCLEIKIHSQKWPLCAWCCQRVFLKFCLLLARAVSTIVIHCFSWLLVIRLNFLSVPIILHDMKLQHALSNQEGLCLTVRPYFVHTSVPHGLEIHAFVYT